MKVLSVIHFPEYGGPHNQSSVLSGPLAACDVQSVTVLPPGPGANRIADSGGIVFMTRLGRLRATRSLRTQIAMLARSPSDVLKLRAIMIIEQPAVVQLNGLINPHAAIAARSLGIPVVWQLLDTRPPMKLRRAMAPLVSSLADVVMPVGHAVLDAHPGMDLGPERTMVFYPPVDAELFRPGVSTLRQEFGIDDSVPIIGCVANINPQKGYDTLIEAAGKVLRLIPNAVLVSAGHIYPNHREYYERLVQRGTQLGLVAGHNLFFLDSRSDIPNVLNALDCFVLASVPNSEGTPTAILEAMACELPIVATKVASLPEAVIDCQNGYLVQPGDADALAAKIAELLGNPERAARFGKRSRELVLERFSLDACMQAHMKAYELAIQHRKGRSAGFEPAERTLKSAQSAYYDEIDPEFETSRPHGQPRLYRELLDEKFRRSVAGLGSVASRSALTVCGGSGMDAEYLSRAGSSVVASDLSVGAAARARERFHRFHPSIMSPFFTAADVERLPFPDRSIDLVYVHDGLHHLEDPSIGLREMCRVASWAVSLTEPADAALTGLAVKLGRAEEIEEAGNRVARLDLPTVTRILETEGFTVVRAQRYAMYYKHKPGWVMRLLSLPVLNSLAWLAFDLGNVLIGRWGNKMTVQAIRTEHMNR